MRGIRSLPLRLTLIDVRRPGEIMEDLRGFVLNKLAGGRHFNAAIVG
jgi:hypothetical protein